MLQRQAIFPLCLLTLGLSVAPMVAQTPVPMSAWLDVAAYWPQDRVVVGTEVVPLGGFGNSVGIDGDTVVIGANFDGGPDDYGQGDGTGAAFIFERDLGGLRNWGERVKLTASDMAVGDQFGISVDVHGDTAVVGAFLRAASDGGVYVFERDLGGPDHWGQQAILLGSDSLAGDQFGYAVQIRGDTIVVGAPENDGDGDTAGAAYVFERDLGGLDNWGERARLSGSSATFARRFGWAVAFDGDTVVVGTRRESAYVFERDVGGLDNWGERKRIVSSATTAESFGWSLGLDGDVLVVGALNAMNAGPRSGAAYLLERDLGGRDNWGERRKLLASDATEDDLFGWAIAVAGDTVVVTGVSGADTNGPGKARVFERGAGGPNNWGEVVQIDPATVNGTFGWSVALDGATAVFGDPSADIDGSVNPMFRRGVSYFHTRPRFADNFESGDTSAWTDTVP